MTADREECSELDMGATTETRARSWNLSHQEVKFITTCMGRADNQLIAPDAVAKFKAATP